MVQLKKLVLKNFKSFKKAEIPFINGFSVIAGSNGSGKTNILDALMFVLGATSLKSLRASRLTDLVNNDSNENYAKVELHIEHEKQLYEISRIIDKQGKSVYRMNGERKPMNEISSFLNEIGVSVHGHNIVVQGDVTRIVTMSPIERRELIDEVAGLAEFDAKKAEAIKELEKVNTRTKEATIVLNEREAYLFDLEKEKIAAEEYDALEKEKKSSKATIINTEIQKTAASIQVNREKRAGIAAEKKVLNETLNELSDKNNEMREKAADLNSQIIAHSEKTYSTIGAALEEKKSEKRVIEERIHLEQQSLERNQDRLEQAHNKRVSGKQEQEELQHTLREGEKRLAFLKTSITEVEGQKHEIEAKQERFEKEMAKLEGKLSSIVTQAEETRSELFELQAARDLGTKETALAQEGITEAQEELDGLEKQIAKLEEKKAELHGMVAKESNPKDAVTKTRGQLEKSLESLKSVEAKIEELVDTKKTVQKQQSVCPVCERDLKEELRNKIVSKKTNALQHLEHELKKLAEQRTQLQGKLSEQERMAEKQGQLTHEVSFMAALKERQSKLKEKIAAGQKSIDRRRDTNTTKQIAQLEETLSELTGKRREQEQKIKETKAFETLERFKKVTEQLNELEQEQNGLHQQRKYAKARMEEGLHKDMETLQAEVAAIESEISETKKTVQRHADLLRKAEGEITARTRALKNAEADNQKTVKEKERLDGEIRKTGETIGNKNNKLRVLEGQENELNIAIGKEEVRETDLREEYKEFEGIPVLQNTDTKQLSSRINEIEKKIEKLGAINMRAVNAFEELKTEVNGVRGKVQKLEEERMAVLEMIETIEVKRTNVFMDCFEEINGHFRKMFERLFGGNGLLSLSNPEKPLESGLIIEAKHKGESLKNIDSMSGGEKSLTALSFLFAIQLYEPAPFYVFDEADAALDKENSAKMAAIVKQVSEQSQFIAITHNEQLIKKADQIVGVALDKGKKSSVIGLKLPSALTPAEE